MTTKVNTETASHEATHHSTKPSGLVKQKMVAKFTIEKGALPDAHVRLLNQIAAQVAQGFRDGTVSIAGNGTARYSLTSE